MEYITVKELAQKLKVSTTAIYKKIYAGEIKSVKIGPMHMISKSVAETVTVRRKRRPRSTAKINTAVSNLVTEHLEALKMLGED